jgi:hypothetical protein
VARKKRGGVEGGETAGKRGRGARRSDKKPSARRGDRGARKAKSQAAAAKAERAHPAVSLGGLESLLSGRRAWAAFCVFIVILWIAFYHDIFFGGQTLVSPDAVAPAGFVKVGKESLDAGTYPLWNPYIFLGMPSFSSLSYNPYVYPVGLALKALWPLMRLPMMWLLIYYLAGGLSLFLLLRKMPLPSAAAAFGAVAFMFTPNIVAVGAYGHGSQLMASMYIPIIFLMVHRLFERGSLAYASGLALLFGLQLLRGHVQISYYTAIMIGLAALYWTLIRLRERGLAGSARPLALCALAVALALGMASVLYIPVHNYTDLSVRSAGEHGGLDIQRAGMWSLSPRELSTLLLPGMLGFGGGTYWGSMPFTDYPNAYMGILTLALAIYAVARLDRSTKVLLLLLLATIALLFSFGRHLGPIYELLHRWLPFFNKFRVPVMIVVLFHFACACLAGYGLSAILKGGSAGRRGALLWAMGAVAATVMVFAAAGSGLQGKYTSLIAAARGDQFASVAGPAAFAGLRTDVIVVGLVAIAGLALVFGFRRKMVSAGILSMGLICLCCLDLWRVDYRLMEPNLSERGTAMDTIEEDPVAIFLSKDRDVFRVYPLGRMFTDNTLNAHKVASVGGYHAAKPKLWDDWANAHLEEDIWSATGYRSLPFGRDQRLPAGAMMTGVRRMLNIKYVISEGQLQGAGQLEEVFSEPGERGRTVYLTADYLPRAYCVPSVKRVAPGDDALREILTPSFDPAVYAVVEDDVQPEPAEAGSTWVTSYAVNHVELEVVSEGPTFLVLSDLFMEGWEATRDGDSVPIHKTNYLLRGVAVPAGSHKVRFEYRDPGLSLGLKLGAGSAIVIIGMALPGILQIVGAVRRRRHVP